MNDRTPDRPDEIAKRNAERETAARIETAKTVLAQLLKRIVDGDIVDVSLFQTRGLIELPEVGTGLVRMAPSGEINLSMMLRSREGSRAGVAAIREWQHDFPSSGLIIPPGAHVDGLN